MRNAISPSLLYSNYLNLLAEIDDPRFDLVSHGHRVHHEGVGHDLNHLGQVGVVGAQASAEHTEATESLKC